MVQKSGRRLSGHQRRQLLQSSYPSPRLRERVLEPDFAPGTLPKPGSPVNLRQPQPRSRSRRPRNQRPPLQSPYNWRTRQRVRVKAERRFPSHQGRPASGSKQSVQSSPHPWVFFWLSLLRLMILGVGVAAIAGTLLSIWNPASQIGRSNAPGQTTQANAVAPVAEEAPNPMQPILDPNQEMTAVKQQIQALAAAQPGLTPGLFLMNLDTGAHLNLAGAEAFPAASMIKVPVLIAFFQDVDAGKLSLDEELVMRPDLIASESGEMQYQDPGTKFSALETATLMIVISDNTATNMLIDRLGGIEQLNQRFRSWGLTQTVIRNPLPDLEGTNTTSPQELAMLMARVSKGELVTLRSRDRMLDIMGQTVTDTLLPQGLGAEATIAHKTGDIGSLVGDVGLIDMPNGQRYVAAAMVKRPHNDPRAQELIRKISRLTYQSQIQAPPSPATAAN